LIKDCFKTRFVLHVSLKRRRETPGVRYGTLPSVCALLRRRYTCSVSQKTPTFYLRYNLVIRDPITIILGRIVTKKVRNQMMLCFPTSRI